MRDYKGINQSDSAVVNRSRVLRIINEYKSITRIKLSELTGLRTSTITYIISDLKNNKFITEKVSKKRNGKKGAPTSILSIDKNYNYVIGVDVKYNYFRILIMNLAGDIIKSIEKNLSLDNFDDLLEELINEILNIKNKYSDKRFLGIGIGIPGVINSREKKILISSVFNIKNYDIGKKLSQSLDLPVYLDNNANLVAYNYYFFNYKNKFENLISIFYQYNNIKEHNYIGIGIGLILNGDIYYGEHYSSGEINDIISKNTNHIINFNTELFDILNENKKNIILEFGNIMGSVISNLINILNPGVVLNISDFRDKSKLLFPSILKSINKNVLPFIKESITIISAEEEQKSVAIGGCALVIDKFYREYNIEKYLIKN